VDIVRTLTESDVFASGPTRINGPLLPAELRNLIHPHEQFETLDRFRIRYRWLPMFEIFYGYAHAEESQTTNFYYPGKLFNDVKVQRYGIAAERPIDAYPFADILLRVEAGWGDRWGLVEFQPSAREALQSVTAKGVFSRFIPGEDGSTKASLEVNYTNQDYYQQVSCPLHPRGLEIVGATLHLQRYSVTTYQRPYEPRSDELLLGAAFGQETFGTVRQNRDDYFVGYAIRGLEFLDFLPSLLSLPGNATGRLDLIVQPTVFTSNHSGILQIGQRGCSPPRATEDAAPASSHSQYQTAAAIQFRWIDFANEPTLTTVPAIGPLHLSQLNLVLPFSQAVAVSGPRAYEDFSIGADLFTNVIADFSTADRFAGATILAAAGYRYERFYHLADNAHLFHVSLQLGF
jgi:hypothetical protein